MEKLKFSLFEHSAGPKIGDIDLKKVVDYVTNDSSLKKTTEHYRTLLKNEKTEEDKKNRVKYKRYNFPMLKPLGVFSELAFKGFDPETYTSLAPFDLDPKDHPEIQGKQWDDLFLKISGDPHVAFMFVSPSKGIKGLLKLDYPFSGGQNWRSTLLYSVYPHFEKKWSVRFDAKQAEPHMGIFLSHDPYPHLNLSPQPFKAEDMSIRAISERRFNEVGDVSEDVRVKNIKWLLSALQNIEGGQVYPLSVGYSAVIAKMIKGGSLNLTPEEAKDLIWANLQKAPGVSVPKKARADAWGSFDWALEAPQCTGITDDDLKFGDLAKQLKTWAYSISWQDGKCPYIAVGDNFFYVTPPGVSQKEGALKARKPETIKRMNPRPRGQDVLTEIPYYQDFIHKPNFLNYERIVDGIYYNEASPLACEPVEGDWETIKNYIKQLFGNNEVSSMNQVELVYDLLKLMIEHPEKKVPIMALVSRNQGTGKSFIFELLLLIFGEDNCKMVTYEDFNKEFNRSWANKYIVFIDEIPENKSEKFYTTLKEITYRSTIDINEKYMSRYEIDNYIHFFLTSNRVDDFVKIEDEDSRMWIREVPPIKKGQYDKDIKKKFKNEVGHFLHFLLNREYTNEIDHRFSFDKELYRTERWQKIVENQKSHIYHHLKDRIREDFETRLLAQEKHVYQKSDIKEMMEDFSHRWTSRDLIRCMENEFRVDYKNNSGNKKGYLISREMVEADPIITKNGNKGNDQSSVLDGF